MTSRIATCRCGAVTARCTGEPVRISVCHCLECQKRTGSVFGTQARFSLDRVEITGETRQFERIADSGNRTRYRFCPQCGSTIAYENEGMPGFIAIPVGAFADPHFPAPSFSVYEHRKHAWVHIGGDQVEHVD